MEGKNLLFVISNKDTIRDVLSKQKTGLGDNNLIFMAEGSAQSSALKLLGMTKTSKELALISIDNEKTAETLDFFDKKLNLSQKNTGIAFCVPMKAVGIKSRFAYEGIKSEDYPYSCIIVIVDKDKSRKVMDSAERARVRGGTILSARGGGVPQDFYFPLTVEPQKDVVLIVAKNTDLDRVTQAFTKDLELEKPGAGVMFVLPVTEAIGLPSVLPKEGKAE